MDPMTAMMVAGTVTAGIGEAQKLASAIKQKRLSNQLGRMQRPQYSVPGQVTESTGLARMAALDPRLPGQAMMEQNVMATTQDTIRAAQESGGNPNAIMGGIIAAGSNQQAALGTINQQAMQQQEMDRRNLQGQLHKEAAYADKAWETNRMQPYQEAQASSSALAEASNRNLYSGVRGIGGVVAGMPSEMFGKQTGNPVDMSGMEPLHGLETPPLSLPGVPALNTNQALFGSTANAPDVSKMFNLEPRSAKILPEDLLGREAIQQIASTWNPAAGGPPKVPNSALDPLFGMK